MSPASKPKTRWRPAPPELLRLFEGAMRQFPEAQVRKMFGYPVAFMNGNMFGGLFQDCMILRLSEDDRAAIRDQAGARPFEPMPGRVMREYVVLPEAILKSNARLKTWVSRAFAYARSLPAKASKLGTKKRGGAFGPP